MTVFFILSSPSGAGKSTLCKYLTTNCLDMENAISATTRQPRLNEKSGREYYFMSVSEFEEAIKRDEFLEYAQFCGNYYGTLKSEIERIEKKGKKMILFDIEWNGAEQIKNNTDFNILSVFILPPSFTALKERLLDRNLDSINSINTRLENAKLEIKHAINYDYIIINDDLNQTKKELLSVYTAEKLRANKLNYLELVQKTF